MTAARRGQKAFPPTATSSVAKLPQWRRPATLQPNLDHPANAASVPPSCAPTSSGRVVGQGVTMQSVEK